MTVIQAHYVLARSGEAALGLASLIAEGRMKPMACSPQSLLALAALHPLGYRPSLLPFLVYTGISQPQFKLIVSGEKPCP